LSFPLPWNEIRRNDPCPCGSGVKYKRCCRREVEEAEGIIGQAVRTDRSELRELVRGLAFMAGLRPDEDERPPDPQELAALLKEVISGVQGRKTGALRRWEEGLKELLRSAREARFPPVEATSAYVSHPTIRESLSEDAMERRSADIEVLDEVLTPFVTPELVEEVYWSLVAEVRGREISYDEMGGLICGLWSLCRRDDPGRSPLWMSLWLVSLEEHLEVTAIVNDLVEKIGKGGLEQEDVKRLENLFIEHPAYERELSAEHWKEARTALEAIVSGDVSLDIPLYAVIHGALGLAKASDELVGICLRKMEGEQIPPVEALSEVLFGEELMLKPVMEGLGEDHIPFVDAVSAALEAWLDEFDAAPTREREGVELRDSMESLLDTLQLYFTTVYEHVVVLMYFQAVLATIGDPEKQRRLQNSEALRGYAEELAAGGNMEAAKHVRRAIRAFGC